MLLIASRPRATRTPVRRALAIALAALLTTAGFGGLLAATPAGAAPGDVFSIGDDARAEGNSGTTSFTFTVSRDAGGGLDVVDYQVTAGTATSGQDFTPTTGTLTFTPATPTRTITVQVTGDTRAEPNETFFVDIDPFSGSCTDCRGVGTIQNDDADAPGITITNVAVTESNADVDAVFTVRLTEPATTPITVHYATANGTAVAPGDYTPATGDLLFAVGDDTETVSVKVKGDALDENSEVFFLNLSNAVDATILDSQGEATITDDDLAPTLSIDDREVTESTTPATFTVTLSAPSEKTVTVDYATANGTATAGSDYVATKGTLIFNPNQTTKTIDVPIINDTADETSPEGFVVNLTNEINAGVTKAQGQGTITDDDGLPVLAISGDPTLEEGNSGTTNALFTVTLTPASGLTVTVDYDTADGTATTADDDYEARSGTLTFLPGETSKQISVPVNGDLRNEANEAFTVDLSDPTQATVGDGQATATITNDDALPALSIDDRTVDEGDAPDTVEVTFTVTLSQASGRQVTVDYTTANGTAAAGTDYDATTGTLTFAPDDTSETVTVVVRGDNSDEADETFRVDLSNPNRATIADGQGIGTITDDDDGPTIAVTNDAQAEGTSGSFQLLFTVTLSETSAQEVTVDYATADGSATAGEDYESASGSLTFSPGQTTKSVPVTVLGDDIAEADETFTLELSNAGNATIADGSGTGTIINDDGAPPAASISDVTASEGNGGATAFSFVVSLSGPSTGTVTIDFATAAGTATAGVDYQSSSGAVVFAPGDTSETITVDVNGETTHEPDETFFVNLTNPRNATIADGQGLGSITNDDGVPAISVSDVVVTEGDAGTANAIFVVSLSNASSEEVTVDYATGGGNATASSDYSPVSGTLTFAPGQTVRTVVVQVIGDTTDEVDETFDLTLSDPSASATIADGTGTATITDDDAAPTVSISNAQIAEPATGTDTVTFTVLLSAASGQTVTVQVTTADGTAVAPGDYTARTELVSFAPGQTSRSFDVVVNGDALDEDDETFTATLSSPTNASTSGGPGTATIADSDATPTVSIAGVTVAEGTGATATAADFTLTLSAPSGRPVSVDVTTADGSAVQPGDYTSKAQTVVFAIGETTKLFTVDVVADTTDEASESFTANLSNPVHTSIVDGSAAGTITDDDGPAGLTIGDVTVAEGNGPAATPATFTVTLTPASGQTVTVDHATASGTATTPSDFSSTSGSLTFLPGETTKTIVVGVVGDGVDEPDEAFSVVLSNPSNATLDDDTGVATITDDDTTPTISIDDVTVTEGAAATTTSAVFDVVLSGPSASTVTVTADTADGTATAPDDYTAVTGQLVTFAPGETVKPVTVTVKGDGIDEADEGYTVQLSSATNADISDATGAGTITDDDTAPTMAITDVTVTEGNGPGSVNATFDVTLSAPSVQTVTVLASTANGTAAAPGDYTAFVNQLVTFNPGETTKQVTVAVQGDSRDESNETFFVNLSGASGASISDGQGQGTINDNDPTPTIGILDAAVTEGNAGTVNAAFVVTLSSQSESVVTVQAGTTNGTATQPGDYTATGPVTVTFNPGEQSQTVDVPVKGDALDEPNETFSLKLSAPSGGGVTIADDTGVGTITDDDGAPTISIADATTTEGNSTAVVALFTVTLSTASGQPVTVGYRTADGTATAGTDYTAASGTVTFVAGETSKTIGVNVPGDTADEANETFTVTLADPTNATIADGQATGTINDDDDPVAKPEVPQGYSLVGEDGALYAFGTAKNLGDMRGKALNAPIIGVAYTPGGNGYWLVARDGGIFTFGDAAFFGSMGDQKLNSPVIGMAATPTGKGYWLFAGDGGIFTFGDAEFFGSMGDKKLNAPVINMEPLASGRGYWLVAADGGIFTFGLGDFFGSMGDQKLNQPVFDMTSTDSDNGYWLVARDGGIFSFGDAGPKFFGSAVNETPKPTRIIGMDATPDSQGYWIADASGKVYRYGNAQDLGDRAGSANPAPMVAFATVPSVKQAA